MDKFLQWRREYTVTDSQDKNVQTLWPITCVIGQPLPKNGQTMADGQLLFHTLLTYEFSNSWEALVYTMYMYIVELWLEAITGRKAVNKQSSYHDLVILASKHLTIPILIEHRDVEHSYSRVADTNLKIGWGTNTNHAEGG